MRQSFSPLSPNDSFISASGDQGPAVRHWDRMAGVCDHAHAAQSTCDDMVVHDSGCDETQEKHKLQPDTSFIVVHLKFDKTCQLRVKDLVKHKKAYAQIIKAQGLEFWTRLCISVRCDIASMYGAAYCYRWMDGIFINLLEIVSDTDREEEVIDFFIDVKRVASGNKVSVSIKPSESPEECGDTTKKQAAKKSSLLWTFSQEQLQLVPSTTDYFIQQLVKGEVFQAMNISWRILREWSKVLYELTEGVDCSFKWQFPELWSANSPSALQQPLELEDFLQEEWGPALASEVLWVENEQICWLNLPPVQLSDITEPKPLPRLKKTTAAESDHGRTESHKVPLCSFASEDFTALIHSLRKGIGRLYSLDNTSTEAVSDDDQCLKLLFECIELMVPPVMAPGYHEFVPVACGEVEHPFQAAWFGAWCSVMDVSKIDLSRSPNSSPSVIQKHLQKIRDTLLKWSPPAENSDQLSLEDIMLFLTAQRIQENFEWNPTLRLQWLAVAYTFLDNVELICVPLRFWPVPRALLLDVQRVLTYMQAAKLHLDCALINMENCNRQNKLVMKLDPPLVKSFQKLTSHDFLAELFDLRQQCVKRCAETDVVWACFEKHPEIEIMPPVNQPYIKCHYWNFQFYCLWDEQKLLPGFATFSLEDGLSNFLTVDKSIRMEIEPTVLDLPVDDLVAKLRACGICDNGNFVRRFVTGFIRLGFVPDKDLKRVSREVRYSTKFEEESFEEISVAQYSSLSAVGKISFHSLMLVQATSKFLLNGKILYSHPKSLVGGLVSLSFQLYVAQHLFGLAYHLGKLLDFEPVPLDLCNSSRSFLDASKRVNEICEKKQNYSIDDFFSRLAFETEHASFLGDGQNKSIEYMESDVLNIHYIIQDTGNGKLGSLCEESAHLHYLFPSFLAALPSSCTVDHEGALFYHQVLKRLLQKFDDLAHGAKPLHLRTIKDTFAEMLTYQNKIVQMCNAFVDRRYSGRVSSRLAKIFQKANFLFHGLDTSSPQLLAVCFPRFGTLLRVYKLFFESFVNVAESSAQLLAWSHPSRVTPDMVSTFVYHQLTLKCVNTIEAHLPHGDFAELGVMADALQWTRSIMYLRLTNFGPQDEHEKLFFTDALARFKTMWQKIEALECAKDILAKGMAKFRDNLELLRNAKEDKEMSLSLFFIVWSEHESKLTMDFSGLNACESEKKLKKFLKPPKGIVALLEQQAKQKEPRTCRRCKKKESPHRPTFLTCEECLRTEFPKKTHFCSKRCQDLAWESFHDIEHTLFFLELYEMPDEE